MVSPSSALLLGTVRPGRRRWRPGLALIEKARGCPGLFVSSHNAWEQTWLHTSMSMSANSQVCAFDREGSLLTSADEAVAIGHRCSAAGAAAARP